MDKKSFLHFDINKKGEMDCTNNNLNRFEQMGLMIFHLIKLINNTVITTTDENKLENKMEKEIEFTSFDSKNIIKTIERTNKKNIDKTIPLCDFDGKECLFIKTFKGCKGISCPRYPKENKK